MLNQDQQNYLLKLVSRYDCIDGISWTEDLKFFVNCNDLFYWGCGDCEDVETQEDIESLEKSLKDCEYFGTLLYVARKRKMRPQGAYYQYFDKKYWSLLDDCGPAREAKFGNPLNRPDENECEPIDSEYKDQIRSLHYAMMQGKKIEQRFRCVEDEDFHGKTFGDFGDWHEFNYIGEIRLGILELRYKNGDKIVEVKKD